MKIDFSTANFTDDWMNQMAGQVIGNNQPSWLRRQKEGLSNTVDSKIICSFKGYDGRKINAENYFKFLNKWYFG